MIATSDFGSFAALATASLKPGKNSKNTVAHGWMWLKQCMEKLSGVYPVRPRVSHIMRHSSLLLIVNAYFEIISPIPP